MSRTTIEWSKRTTGGIPEPIRLLYNRVRNLFPSKIVVSNGVPTRQGRLFDATDVHPEFKPIAMRALRRDVAEDDHVLVVGGGYGVGAVVAARRVLNGSGRVTVYEASAEHCEHVRETAEMNRVADRIDVEQVLVGDAVDVWGDTSDVTVRPPGELPDADVLYVDVEGAESSIVDGLTIRPSLLIVEYHPDRGVTRQDVVDVMERLGYSIASERFSDVDSTEIVGTYE